MKRNVMVGGLLGIVGGALAIGGIVAALINPDVTVSGNVITAGHLTIEVNGGQPSGFSIYNLAPGELRVAEQLITGDLGGVTTADLAVRVPPPDPTSAPDPDAAALFLANATLAVEYSEAETVGNLGWTGSACSAASTWTPAMPATKLDALNGSAPWALGALTSSADSVCVRYTIGLDAAATNPVQGQTAALTMGYTLTQVVTP